jgi:hypothetical protein
MFGNSKKVLIRFLSVFLEGLNGKKKTFSKVSTPAGFAGKYTRALNFEIFFFCHFVPIWPIFPAAADVGNHIAVACLQPRCPYL